MSLYIFTWELFTNPWQKKRNIYPAQVTSIYSATCSVFTMSDFDILLSWEHICSCVACDRTVNLSMSVFNPFKTQINFNFTFPLFFFFWTTSPYKKARYKLMVLQSTDQLDFSHIFSFYWGSWHLQLYVNVFMDEINLGATVHSDIFVIIWIPN